MDAVAARLLADGHRAGDRVGVRVGNGLPVVTLTLAAWRLGLVLVPLHPRLTDAEAASQAERARVATVIADPAFVDAAPPVREPVTPADPGDNAPSTLVFTSGSTGKPKPAVLTRGNWDAVARGARERLGHDPADRWLLAIPACHVGGLSVIHRALRDRVTLVVHERFDAARVNAAIDAGDVTCASLVPTMLHRLLDARADRAFPGTLRCVLLGGAAAAPRLLDRARKARAPVAVTYGLTEACSQVATTRPGACVDAGGVGAPLAGTEIRIRDADARGVGEVLVRGPTVFAEYDGDAEATARALHDGWLHTGDFGRLDANGHLSIEGRRADLIVTGGENVYPAEVERALLTHPAVADAVVAGVPDAEWGARVAAIVEVAKDAKVTTDELDSHARAHLAAFKVPRKWMLVDALPRTPAGKVARAEAVARWLDGQ